MKILSIAFEQYYLPGKPVLPLLAVCELSASGDIRRACISDQCEALQHLAEQGNSIEQMALALGIAVLDFSLPFRLQPVHIPKPWGQEIWYTGIEARGVSQVISETGITPLSWAIAVDRHRILGSQEHPNLLKILDPLPDEVYGDLYFELHEQKREVYIVTHIDRRAWPDGVGAIRLGFSQEKRQQFSSDESFLSAYRTAVQEYYAVRKEIDGQLDAQRVSEGIALQAPLPAVKMQELLVGIPQDVAAREMFLRAAIEAFTAMKDLRVGDVLAVPLRVPHALQHGVRTVEFQTPVYERKILSFAQKVLTQDHWDTDEALKLVQLQTPPDAPFPVLQHENGVKVEQIVQFDDFVVQRIYLDTNASILCETGKDYVLLMTVAGRVVCGASLLESEQAAIVPACAASVLLQNPFPDQSIVLLARPC